MIKFFIIILIILSQKSFASDSHLIALSYDERKLQAIMENIEKQQIQAEKLRKKITQEKKKNNNEANLEKTNKKEETNTQIIETFNASTNGHFYIKALINNKEVLFLVYSGASSIVLTKKDAKNVGIKSYKLNFKYEAKTAKGIAKFAKTNIEQISVGKISFNNIEVAISKSKGLDISLLGTDFLNLLSKYEVTNNQLIMYK